jgi:Suppressor of fused protein (SUFU)
LALDRAALDSETYCHLVRNHYVECWRSEPETLEFRAGPIQELPPEFKVIRFAPTQRRKAWTYATVCMSQPSDVVPLELHLLAPVHCDKIVELLVAAAHFHRTGERLGLGHSVNFGRAWCQESGCDHGLISLPYLDGPKLEWLELGTVKVRFLWLIPVTKSEIEFKKANGLSSLENAFEKAKFNYLDPKRPSVV